MPAVKLPTIPDIFDHPKVAAAQGRFNELQRELTALQREEAELSRPESPFRRYSEVEAEADALTTDGGVAVAVQPASVRLAEVRERIAVLREAAAKQGRITDREIGNASREIVTGLLPTHKEIVGRLATAVAEFEAAHRELVTFHDRLRAAGLTGYGATLRNLCLPEDVVEQVAGFRVEAAEFGYLKGAK